MKSIKEKIQELILSKEEDENEIIIKQIFDNMEIGEYFVSLKECSYDGIIDGIIDEFILYINIDLYCDSRSKYMDEWDIKIEDISTKQPKWYYLLNCDDIVLSTPLKEYKKNVEFPDSKNDWNYGDWDDPIRSNKGKLPIYIYWKRPAFLQMLQKYENRTCKCISPDEDGYIRPCIITKNSIQCGNDIITNEDDWNDYNCMIID